MKKGWAGKGGNPGHECKGKERQKGKESITQKQMDES